ncbi:MAG: helicase associated domain-containing protein, partial [Clostridiales bacterium]|nr:helicase associated domain-containing protein [Clostridiales bacterium]
RLDAIGMIWSDRNERQWDKYFEQVKQYYQLHGNLSIPKTYEVDGLKLGNWLSHQKSAYRAGRLSERRSGKLREIGIHKEIGSWEYKVVLVRKYLQEHKIGYIPQDVVVEGVWLGKWLAVQRKALEAGKLKPEQVKLLTGIPMRTKNEELWEKAYEQACAYYKTYGDLNISRGYVTDTGYRLGNWVSRQRQLRREGHLSDEQVQRLDAIGFVWEAEKTAV